jgi:hypothetical protein
VVDFANRKLSTATCSLVGDNLHTGGAEYGVIIRDLCQCMVQAIDLDDTDGKFAIGAALHIALGSVLAS